MVLKQGMGLCLCLCMGSSLSLDAQAARPEEAAVLTPQALAELDRVGAPALSPDGMRIAYTVTGERLAGSGPRVRLMVGPSGEWRSATVVLEADRAIDQVSWSEDGTRLYYLTSAPGTPQLWSVGASGGPPRQVTDLPLSVIAYRLADHDRLLITAHDAWPDCEDLACSKTRQDQEAALRRGPNRADSGLMYRDGQAVRYMDSYVDGRFTALFQSRWTQEAPVTEATAVMRGYRYDVMERNFTPQIDFSVSGDGQQVVVGLRPSGSNQTDELPKRLFEISLPDSRTQMLETPAGRSAYRPRLSPDGRHLAYLQAQGSEHTAPRVTVWVRDRQTQREVQLAPQLDVLVTDIGWSSEGRAVYAIGAQGVKVRLFELSLQAPDTAVPVPSRSAVLQWSSRGGRLAVLDSDLQHPPALSVHEAAVASPFGAGPVAQEEAVPVPVPGYLLGEASVFRFRGWHQDPVEGLVLRPAGFQPGERYPVVFLLHGGPNGVFSDSWSAGVLAPQLFAARGYAVVMINPHGSAGYGTAFGRSVLRHWADRPMEDLKAGWAHALARFPFLDGNRACAVGGSYGGYLTLMLAGQWSKPWKCLVNGQGIFDTRSFYYANDITTYDRLSLAERPWDPEIEQQNPARHVARWTTPLFIIAGGRDYRVPVDQTLGAYKAASLRQVPTQVLIFPDEGHGQFSLPNRIRTMDEVLRWLDRWTAP